MAVVRNDTVTTTATVGVGAPMSGDADGIAMAPERIGDYVIVERLGAGAAGAVYSAYDPNLDRTVALKLLHEGKRGSTSGEALLAEARALARLSHPNVVRVHDVGAHHGPGGDSVFMAMEYVDGSTLKRWVTRERPSAVEIRRAYVAAGHGLAAAHASGLVHRDFKPGNVMMASDGRVLVTDFGLARRDSSTLTPKLERARDPEQEQEHEHEHERESQPTAIDASTVHYAGTPAYMAPEQHQARRVDARADQFAFCVALWEALCGRHPFAGDTLPTLRDSVLAGRIVPPSGGVLDPRTEAALRRGMSVDPEDRFADMEALLAEIVVDPAQRRRRRRWSIAAVGAAVVIAALVIGRREATVLACEEEAAALEDLGWPAAEERAAAWAELARDNCMAAHEDGERDPERVALVRACLAERRAELEALATATADESRRAEALRKLPAPARCVDDEALRHRETSEADAPLDEVVRVRGELARARASFVAGELESAWSQAEAAVDDDRPPWLAAEAEVVKGRVRLAQGERTEAAEILQEAYFAAIAGSHDATAADAAASLADALQVPADVEHWRQQAMLSRAAAAHH